MNREEKEKLIFKEIEEKYEKYFEKIKYQKDKNEIDANARSKKFHDEIEKYIKQRKKELNIE